MPYLILSLALPTVIVKPKQIATYEGNDVSVVCNATGNPKPSIKWRRVIKKLPSNARVENNGKLVLTNMQKIDGGLYQCIAENPVGRADDSATVVVQGTENCFLYKGFEKIMLLLSYSIFDMVNTRVPTL